MYHKIPVSSVSILDVFILLCVSWEYYKCFCLLESINTSLQLTCDTKPSLLNLWFSDVLLFMRYLGTLSLKIADSSIMVYWTKWKLSQAMTKTNERKSSKQWWLPENGKNKLWFVLRLIIYNLQDMPEFYFIIITFIIIILLYVFWRGCSNAFCHLCPVS